MLFLHVLAVSSRGGEEAGSGDAEDLADGVEDGVGDDVECAEDEDERHDQG